MGLVKYKEKRNFKESPEPTGGKPVGAALRFVIQKHAASHLHYDFRLEMEGVLKSWAVPKGPSTDSKVKRLAMMVEDHPFDYRNFEGIIPSGYGAGTVIIWDEGTYEAMNSEKKDKKSQEKLLLKELDAGSVKIVLHGKKLKGAFALIKTKGMGENAWLLIKEKDKYVSEADITRKDKSVISSKTLEQVEKTSKNFYGEKRVKEASAKTPKKAVAVKKPSATTKKEKKTLKTKTKTSEEKAEKGKPAKFPLTFSPMLATLVDKPFDEEGWLYEVKWDGYRAIALCNKDKVELKSRNDKSFNDKFYPVLSALQDWGVNAVVDGEVVALDENGKSDFGTLQNWRSEADGNLFYYVFDLLWLNGKDLTQVPFNERREILEGIMPENSIIRLSETFEGSGIEFFEAARKMHLEGTIAKKTNSLYTLAFAPEIGSN